MTQISDLKLDGMLPGIWYNIGKYRNLARQTFAATGAWTQVPPAGAAWVVSLAVPHALTVRVHAVLPVFKALNDLVWETIQFRIYSSKLVGGVGYGGASMRDISAAAGKPYMNTAAAMGYEALTSADGTVTYTVEYLTYAPVNNIKLIQGACFIVDAMR